MFTERAVGAIYEYSKGVARKINKVGTACLMHAAQRQTKLIDDHVVRMIIEDEFDW